MICKATNSQSTPQLCTDGVGGAIITWYDYRDSGTTGSDIYAQRINSTGGIEWTANGTVICNAINTQYGPQLCSDGVGGAIITWYDYRDSETTGVDIYTQRIKSTGGIEWSSNGLLICNANNTQTTPQICNDGKGNAIITWTDYRDLAITSHDVYALKISPVIPLSHNWTVGGIDIWRNDTAMQRPQICSDGVGGAIITWQDYRDSATTGSDIYTQRINSTGGIEWTANGSVICNAIESQHDLQICSDGVGGAIIVWRDSRDSATSGSDIYAQHINSTGGVEWTVNGTLICNAIATQYNVQICSDGVGGAIIAWQDSRDSATTGSDIYAQRIDSTGDVEWMVNGTVICNATKYQQYPQLCSDGVGGAIITWYDYRDSTTLSYDIYAQHINSTGGIEWTANGTVICNKSREQSKPQLCSDGVGGAIIAWQDYRDLGITNYDIYAQHINSTGGIEWSTYDRVVCNATNNQEEPQLCSDGVGGAIIAWSDKRAYGSPGQMNDIYAQRINSTGGVEWTANGSQICQGLAVPGDIRLIKDNRGGAIIVWENYTFGVTGYDLNAQHIAYNGVIEWPINGTEISRQTGNQLYPQICSDGVGGALITWEDRRYTYYDIFASRIILSTPISNNPEPITTYTSTPEEINWILTDYFGGGSYRVIVNDSYGNNYTYINWTSWNSNPANLYFPINHTIAGLFYYTIEYYNEFMLYGIPNTVNVTILEDKPPYCNQPGDVLIHYGNKQNITWILYDDDWGGGSYCVKSTHEKYGTQVLKDWTSWNNETEISIEINSTEYQELDYKIEYTDFYGQFRSDNVHVTITDLVSPIIEVNPSSNNDLFGKRAPDLYLEITEPNYNNTWYTLDGGITNFTCTTNLTIDQESWDKYGNGTVDILIFSKDDYGNIGFLNYTVRKDIIPPDITIEGIKLNDEFSDIAPSFELTVIDPNLESVWYTLDDGATNISLSSFQDHINQSLWDELSYGQVTIRFYANDTVGNIGMEEIRIIKINEGGLDLGVIILGASIAGGAGAIIGTAIIITPRIKKQKYIKNLKLKAKEDLQFFEQKIQQYLVTQLEDHYGDEWWEKGVPENLRININTKLKAKGIPPPKLEAQNMTHLEYNDYFPIITEDENWNDLFSDVFVDKDSLGENFENLRNFKSNLEKDIVTVEELNGYPLFLYSITNCFTKTFNVFLSYSTRDTDHFNIKEISKRLEEYPKIDTVFYWEEDSGEDIVKYMERALKISRVFILFCTENSLKSKAVTDEWESAFQLRKEGMMKILPVYEQDKNIPVLLKPILNVKYDKDNFDEFIENLYKEITR